MPSVPGPAECRVTHRGRENLAVHASVARMVARPSKYTQQSAGLMALMYSSFCKTTSRSVSNHVSSCAAGKSLSSV